MVKETRIWAQDIQAHLASLEGSDEAYAEWCNGHCRICGKELSVPSFLEHLKQMLEGKLDAREIPEYPRGYPVEYPGGGYRQLLCSPECDGEWLIQFPKPYGK